MRLHREQERELLGAGRDGELRPGPVQVRLEPVPLRAHPGVSSARGELGREGASPALPSPAALGDSRRPERRRAAAGRVDRPGQSAPEQSARSLRTSG